MTGALLALALALAGPVPESETLLTPAAFRDRMARSASALTHRRATAIDDRTFRTHKADGEEITVSIDNAYQQYRATPANLDAILARYVRLLIAADGGDEPVERLVIVVRPSDYLQQSARHGGPDLSTLPEPRPLAGDLAMFLAIDGDETIRLAMAKDLERWKLDVPSAWTRALANTRARMGPLTLTHLGSEQGATGLGAQSGLAPGLLADPAVCGATAGDAEGRLVLAYGRDMILLADPANAAATTLFRKTAGEEIAAGRSLSSTVLACRDGRWVAERAR